MTKEELIKHYNELANNYEQDVLEDNIKVGEWIKKAVERHIQLRKKYEFRQDKVNRVFSHYYYLRLDNKPFKLMAWQCWMIKSIYGLYHYGTDDRVIKHILLTLGRGNGKTGFAASLSLYHLLKEDQNPQVLLTATTNKQANIALNEVKRLIDSSKPLKKRLHQRIYDITLKKRSGVLMSMSNTPEKLDGWSPSFNIADEQGSFLNKKLLTVIKSGMIKRNNPIIFQIGTAGYNKDSPYYTDIEVGKKVLKGEEDESLDNTLYFIYQLDAEDEIETPKNWVKANPSIGNLLNLRTLKEDYYKSKKYPSEYDEFIIKNLNWYYSDIDDNWIEDEVLKKNFKDFDISTLKGCKAYGGVDLSATRDLASLTIAIEKDQRIYTITEFYYPDSDYNRIRKNGIDLNQWIEAGYIINTEKKTIDYDHIYNRIMYYNDLFDLQAVGYDKWNSAMLIPKVELAGIQCNNCPQNASFFNAPLKWLERAIYEGNISMQKNPVLRWNFRNVVLYRDGNDNIKIIKNKSKDAVDGCVSMGMAIGQYLELSGNDLYYNELFETTKQ